MRLKKGYLSLLKVGLVGVLLSLVPVFQNCSPMRAAQGDRADSVDPRLLDVSDDIAKFSESNPDPKKCFLESISILNWSNAQDFTELNFSTLDILYSPTLVTVISIANENSSLEPLPADLNGWSIQPVRKIVKQQQTVTDIVVKKYSTTANSQLDCYVGSPGHLELIKDIGQSGDPVSLLGLLNDTSKLIACKISKGDEKITVSSSDRKLIQISAAAPIVFKRGCNVEYEREKLEEQANINDEINLQEKAKAFSAQLTDLPDDLVTATAAATTPGEPRITSVVAGNQSVEIRFTPPSSIGSSPITTYDIFFNDNGFPSRSATSSPVTITGLLNDTPIKFKIAANNMSGRGPLSAAFSDTVTPNAATAPAPPVKVRAEAQSGTQDEYYNTSVFFDPPGHPGYSKITRYDVYNSAGEIVATGSGSPITVVYSDLDKKTVQSSGTSYTYSVKAVNAQGSSLISNSTTAITAPGKVWILPADAPNESERGVILSSYKWSPSDTNTSLDVKIRFKRKPIINQNPQIAPIPRPEDPIRPDEYSKWAARVASMLRHITPRRLTSGVT